MSFKGHCSVSNCSGPAFGSIKLNEFYSCAENFALKIVRDLLHFKFSIQFFSVCNVNFFFADIVKMFFSLG